ncbi:hypothetical protein [Brevibacillus laterosporus]
MIVDYVRSDVQQYMDYLVAKKKSASTINKIYNANQIIQSIEW